MSAEQRWEEAGIYQPDAPEAGERRELIEFLVARGATLEQMVEAERLGGLPGLAGDLVRGIDRWTLSVEELAERSGVTVERAERVLLAAGLPVAAHDKVPEDLVAIMPAFEQASGLMGDEATLAFTRVLGAAATNIAEGAIALFYAELGPGTEREGSTELERARLSELSSLAFLGVSRRAPRICWPNPTGPPGAPCWPGAGSEWRGCARGGGEPSRGGAGICGPGQIDRVGRRLEFAGLEPGPVALRVDGLG